MPPTEQPNLTFPEVTDQYIDEVLACIHAQEQATAHGSTTRKAPWCCAEGSSTLTADMTLNPAPTANNDDRWPQYLTAPSGHDLDLEIKRLGLYREQREALTTWLFAGNEPTKNRRQITEAAVSLIAEHHDLADFIHPETLGELTVYVQRRRRWGLSLGPWPGLPDPVK